MNKMADENDSLTKELSLIYLDSDICVSMTGGDKDNLQVYTKNQEWIESRMTRVSYDETLFHPVVLNTRKLNIL